MPYSLQVPKHLDKLFSKLSNRNKLHFQILSKKLKKITENPEIGKPLRGLMSGQRRVHIGKSFVLTYEIFEQQKIIRLLDYARG